MPKHPRTARLSIAGPACLLAVGIASFLIWRTARADSPSPTTAPAVDFVRDVQPIFAANCYTCHNAAKHKGGLRLDNRSEALLGGDNGVVLTPRDAEKSRLVQLVRGDSADSVMPPKGKRLTPAQIATLHAWVQQGAVWPDNAAVAKIDGPTHWSFTKPVRPEPPKGLVHAAWVRNPIDAFVLAKLEEKGLAPSPETDRYTLIRRASLDLTGLPPTPAEITAFVEDKSPDAYEKLLDRLLANPHYGERWARMWLDLARYADSAGYGSDPLRKTIHRYRDWVIEAFNRNLPYDRFTVEQLAGDMLPKPTTEQLIATAFHRNTMTNTEGGTDAEEFRVAAVKDRVDSTIQVWMGLTMGCAQCHSHKYDPITNREYYQLFAIFNQSEDANRGDESPTIPTPSIDQTQHVAELQAEIAKVEQEMTDPARVAVSQAKWEKTLSTKEPAWVGLEPSSLAASSGATLTKQPDYSILASGKSADKETYTIIAPTDLRGITAFRLEAIPDPSLPANGPGRSGSGNFVLSDLKVSSAAASNATLHGRFVRLENTGPQKILHIAEVQVFNGADNVARQGKATQSSTDYGGAPERAIDGNTDGEFFRSNSVTHTKQENDPWWEVDLGAARDISRMVVWNRTDGGTAGRLTDGRVTVFDDAHHAVWQTQLRTPPNPSVELGPSAAQAIALANASDSYHQVDGPPGNVQWSADKAIDADPNVTGWAVAPQSGKANTAVFETVGIAGMGPGTSLSFTLSQNFSGAAIGHFRLSATTDPRPIVLLPAAVREALAVPVEVRNDEQKRTIFAYYKAIAPELAASRQKLAQLRKSMETDKPTQTAIMRDLPANQHRENRVLVKGNFLTKGAVVQPAVLSAFNPMPKDSAADRLGLATWLVDSDNPLTARVAVNRFWAQLFGTGIVETQEDFGTQGQPPSNQLLLDWLATDFMSHQWDIKGFIKQVMTSAAYRQSSRVTPELLAKDPRNRLISRGPRLRLEAELVRDQALALSGLLSPKMFGPSVYPPQPPNLWQAAFNGERTYPTSTGEDAHRRGIYTFWRRTTPYPSMAAFDAPSREVCTVRRIQTSTPLQAFVTLNDPVYVECAQALSRRIMQEGGATPEQRAAFALGLCLSRPAREAQIAQIVSLYQSELTRYRSDPASAAKFATEPLGALPPNVDVADAAAWTVVSNVLLNLDGVLTKN